MMPPAYLLLELLPNIQNEEKGEGFSYKVSGSISH